MDETSLYIILTIIFMWLIGVTISVILVKSNLTLLEVFKKFLEIILGKDNFTDKEEVDSIMKNAGYDYDVEQDIFYSREDAWQKSYGYCRLYDEAASAFSMIMDSEPIYFQYDNKKWLIEFWKGQYGMCTGGEVGVYQSKKDGDAFSKLFNSTFYNAMEDDTNINIKFTLRKNGEELFTREGRYWWITGFILGEYSEPEELSMNIEITLENKEMLQAFVKGLEKAGYFHEEFEVEGYTVKLNFEEPHTAQPYGRIDKMGDFKQKQNKTLCDHYKLLIDSELNSFDNLVRLKEIESDMFDTIIDLLSSKNMLDIYESVKKYID